MFGFYSIDGLNVNVVSELSEFFNMPDLNQSQQNNLNTYNKKLPSDLISYCYQNFLLFLIKNAKYINNMKKARVKENMIGVLSVIKAEQNSK